MKVEGPGKARLLPAQEGARVANASRSEQKALTGERVEVSDMAKRLADARGPSELDTARIERLKDAITAGTFTIDLERIANAMLQEES